MLSLEQALLGFRSVVSGSKSTKKPSSSSSHSPPLSLRFLSPPLRPTIKHLVRQKTPRCSVEFSLYDKPGTAYPRPSEIPWKKELCNSVQLIGTVGTPVQIKHLSSGKTLAWTRIGVKKSAADTTWISLTFWDELAHVASQHVEKGQQIYVFGRLVSDTIESEDGKQQTYYKVVVQQLNFVERNLSSVAMFDSNSNSMTAGRKVGNNTANNTDSIEELWQAFFANPADWWDNRRNKKTPNYPDFKHKDTGEALWIEGKYNPRWVKSQLAILDSRMGSLQDRGSGMVNSISGDNFMSF